MSTITKKELVDRIARSNNTTCTAVKPIVQHLLNEIIAELAKGNRVEFRDFGVFETKMRRAREGHNPKTLESVQIPARRIARFKTGRLMRQKLNGRL
jgi:integration host factor subunit beta